MRTNNTSPNNRERNEPSRESRHDSAPKQESGAFKFAHIGTRASHTTVGGMSEGVIKAFQRTLENAGSTEAPELRPEWHRNKFSLIPIPASRHTGDTPALLVALKSNIGGADRSFAYVLLFETEGRQQARRPVQHRNDNYDAIITPEKALTESFRAEIVRRVGNNAVIVGNQIVPHSLTSRIDPSKDEIHLTAPVLDNAFNAICTFFETTERRILGRTSLSDYRLAPEALEKNERLEVQYDYSNSLVVDTVGLPIGSNILATTYFSYPDESEANAYNRLPILQATAALDMHIVDPEDTTERSGFARRRGNDLLPFLQPVINITSCSPLDATMPFNLGSVLLAIDGIIQQTNNLDWAHPLIPRLHTKGSRTTMSSMVDLSYLPTLNPDLRDQGRVELPPSMEDEDVADFLSTHVLDKVAVGAIISRTSDRSWIMSFFADLARDGSDEMVRILAEEADSLTGGHYSRYAPEGGFNADEIVRLIPTKALIGTWTDEDGNVRSLSEWNVASFRSYLGDRQRATETALDFQRTFELNEKSVEHNLADRFDLLNRHVPDVHVVAFGEQVVFTSEWQRVLSRAIAESRMAPVPTSGNQSLQRGRNTGLGYGSYASSDLGARNSRQTDRNARGARQHGYDLSSRDRY